MPDYYVYLLNDQGRFVDRTDVTCPGDSEAAEEGRAILEAKQPPCAAAEIWLGGRHVATIRLGPDSGEPSIRVC